jgi:uncharacterized protein YaaW (UPF0174 family)
MAQLALREPDNDLIPLLRASSSEDLGYLVEFIMKAVTRELDDDDAFKRQNPRAIQDPPILDGDHTIYVDNIAAEIQKFGGNTIVNLMRGGKGVPYAELVRDVADKMDVSYGSSTDVGSIESQIQIKVMEKAYERMSEQERVDFLDAIGADHAGGIPKVLPVMAVQAAIKLGGFAAYQLALIVANAVARQLIGRGLNLAANAALTRGMAALAGPIGWALTILWTIVDIAGPAYRVTIPCVLHVSFLRQKAAISTCPACHAFNPKTAKFCQSCGAKQEAK